MSKIQMESLLMKLRTWLAGSVTLLVAVQGFAVQKTYTADGDNSTKFPTDRRIYRGDCDPDAATPNAGDDGLLADDQCSCDPTIVGDCAIGGVNAPLICTGGSRAGLNCASGADCPSGTCAAGAGADACAGSTGRPNGGACDPSIAFPATGSCPPDYASGPPWKKGPPNNSDGIPDLTHSSPEPPCNLTTGGSIVIDDTGNNAPTLTSLVLMAEWDDFVGATTVAGVPGATVALHTENTLGPTGGQVGAGSTTTSINWGTLSGWSQTGRLFCKTNCPGGCPKGASGCIPFVGFDGLGPPAPLKATQFNSDPWVFTGDEFTAASFEIVSLGLGAVTAATQIGGRLVEIPALPLAALGGLGAGLVYLGARALGRKRD
jgi:hypothetical protein